VSRSRRVAVTLVATAAVLAVAVSSGLAMRSHATTAQASYTVSGKATGSKGSGTLTGKLTTSGTKRTLTWKLTLSPAGSAISAQIRGGATGVGPKLAGLCAPCSVGAHGTASLTAAALASVVAGRSALVVAPKTGGILRGKLKASKSGGGGTITVPVTAAAVAKGKALAASNGCQGCHTIDGTSSTGPTWKGLAGSKVKLTGGGTLIATDSYLVGVITDPSTLKVAGYDPGVMAEVIPPGKISQSQAEAIVAYIKTLK
jgi:mono/diheme cytochrome c family protein